MCITDTYTCCEKVLGGVHMTDTPYYHFRKQYHGQQNSVEYLFSTNKGTGNVSPLKGRVVWMVVRGGNFLIRKREYFGIKMNVYARMV
jgi:hypothetical protein